MIGKNVTVLDLLHWQAKQKGYLRNAPSMEGRKETANVAMPWTPRKEESAAILFLERSLAGLKLRPSCE